MPPVRKRGKTAKPFKIDENKFSFEDDQLVVVFNIIAVDQTCSFQRAIGRSAIPHEVMLILLRAKYTIDIDYLLRPEVYGSEPWQDHFTQAECNFLLGFLRAIGYESFSYPESATNYPKLPEAADTSVPELKTPDIHRNCQIVNFLCLSHCGNPSRAAIDMVGEFLLGEFSTEKERLGFIDKYVAPLLELMKKDGYYPKLPSAST